MKLQLGSVRVGREFSQAWQFFASPALYVTTEIICYNNCRHRHHIVQTGCRYPVPAVNIHYLEAGGIKIMLMLQVTEKLFDAAGML